MAYMGADYDMDEYEVTDAPEFSRECWNSVKFTLGLDFPNLPYLFDGDVKLTETTAVHRYLADKYAPNLLGDGSQHRAEVSMLESIVYGGVKW